MLIFIFWFICCNYMDISTTDIGGVSVLVAVDIMMIDIKRESAKALKSDLT